MKAKTLTPIRTHRKPRRFYRRPCTPVYWRCKVCGSEYCDCTPRPIKVAPLSVSLPYDLPY